jgi:hypothetical protein
MHLIFIATAAAASLAPWQVSWNAAASDLNAGNAASCLARVPQDPEMTENPHGWLDLGYTCAVVDSNLAAADRYREVLGPYYQPRAALDIHHAWLKNQAGDPEAGRALLGPAAWREREQPGVEISVEPGPLTKTAQWDQATLIAMDPGLDPRAQATLARKLADQGRIADAGRVFNKACPRLSDPEAWGCALMLRIPDTSQTANLN